MAQAAACVATTGGVSGLERLRIALPGDGEGVRLLGTDVAGVAGLSDAGLSLITMISLRACSWLVEPSKTLSGLLTLLPNVVSVLLLDLDASCRVRHTGTVTVD